MMNTTAPDPDSNGKKFHQQCPHCGSSDAFAYYEGNTYCFSCKQYTKQNSNKDQHQQETTATAEIIEGRFTPMNSVQEKLASDKAVIGPITDRGIEENTCRKYNVKQATIRGMEAHLYPYYDRDGNHVVNKIRIVPEKKFYMEGELTKKTGLFGQHLFSGSHGSKYLTITEGEIDCLSAYQMMGSKWPVVSVRNGAASAVNEIKFNLDYINLFKNVVLCFDNDEPGQKAARDIANLLEPGKCKIMYLSMKDANEYLKAGQTQKFVADFWNARTYTPEGIVCGPDITNLLLEEQTIKSLPYPWQGLNALTYGMRFGELVLITAGSGIGKSSVIRELVHYIMKNTKDRVGCLFLEETVAKTGLGILSVEAGKRFHINTSPEERNWTHEDKLKALKGLNNLEQAVFWNHFGSSTLDNLLTRIRYMAKGLDCKYIVIDHISMIIYETVNERKAIDDIMVKLRTLVQELNIHMIVVSHLSRPQGTGHEEGAIISLNQLRGSHSLAQLPDMIYSLERNTQAVKESDRNKTLVRVLKNRFSGESGPATLLLWSKETGLLTEIDLSDINNDSGDKQARGDSKSRSRMGGVLSDDREFD